MPAQFCPCEWPYPAWIRESSGNARAIALQAYVRRDGTEMLGACAFSQTFPRAVVTELREAAACSVVDQMTRTILILAGIGFAVAGVGVLILARGLTRPTLRIGEAARAVGQGDFSVRLPVIRAKAEIGDLAPGGDVLVNAAGRLE